jgi:hypothetical protein
VSTLPSHFWRDFRITAFLIDNLKNYIIKKSRSMYAGFIARRFALAILKRARRSTFGECLIGRAPASAPL